MRLGDIGASEGVAGREPNEVIVMCGVAMYMAPVRALKGLVGA